MRNSHSCTQLIYLILSHTIYFTIFPFIHLIIIDSSQLSFNFKVFQIQWNTFENKHSIIGLFILVINRTHITFTNTWKKKSTNLSSIDSKSKEKTGEVTIPLVLLLNLWKTLTDQLTFSSGTASSQDPKTHPGKEDNTHSQWTLLMISQSDPPNVCSNLSYPTPTFTHQERSVCLFWMTKRTGNRILLWSKFYWEFRNLSRMNQTLKAQLSKNLLTCTKMTEKNIWKMRRLLHQSANSLLSEVIYDFCYKSCHSFILVTYPFQSKNK